MPPKPQLLPIPRAASPLIIGGGNSAESDDIWRWPQRVVVGISSMKYGLKYYFSMAKLALEEADAEKAKRARQNSAYQEAKKIKRNNNKTNEIWR